LEERSLEHRRAASLCLEGKPYRKEGKRESICRRKEDLRWSPLACGLLAGRREGSRQKEITVPKPAKIRRIFFKGPEKIERKPGEVAISEAAKTRDQKRMRKSISLRRSKDG